jgi:uncharacterized membrane protein (UPF0182 family)
MTASPEGELVTWTIPSGVRVDGPSRIAAQMDQQEETGELRRLFDDETTTLSFGNVLLVPVDNAIVYVRSVYVTRDGRPNITAVMVAYQRSADDVDVAVQPTLALALGEVFGVQGIETLEEGTDREGQFDDAGDEEEDGSEEPAEEEPTPSEDDTPAADFEGDDDALVAAIEEAFDQADAALRRGDLAAWTQHVEEAEAWARQLAERREAATGDPPPSTSAPPAGGSTTTTLPGA